MTVHVLMFMGGLSLGAGIGAMLMCCFMISGKESREEGKYLDRQQKGAENA